MVHGGSYHTDIFACMARDAFCLLSNLARSFETSKAAEDTGTAGGIRLEVGASKQQNIKLDFFSSFFRQSLQNEIVLLLSVARPDCMHENCILTRFQHMEYERYERMYFRKKL